MTKQPTGPGPVFDAAQRYFVQWSPLLWEPVGAATTEASAPRPGERVLDVCCGGGASALPAAVKVGPSGSVDGVDISSALLAHGRTVAAQQGLTNIRFIEADVTRYTAEQPYDVVQCAFGVFFLLPDVNGAVARLIELLRPGGRFGATVWARDSTTGVSSAAFDAVRELRPDLPRTSPVWEFARGLDTSEKLEGWLYLLGLKDIEVTKIPLRVPLTPELAWSFVLGTGMRGLISDLSADEVTRTHDRFQELLVERGITELNADSLVGVGRRA
ncbi:class I SAM-dependent methyltransferase [Allokutzneria oryzae]|uniref:Class I SAM-dependent methyltransferase n=1 Tax=Allokutzneria oryzae TaxID=1378989 RepID=A0ABV5ZR48_9PSEU